MKVANGSLSVIGAWGYPHIPQYLTGNLYCRSGGSKGRPRLATSTPINRRQTDTSVRDQRPATGVLLSSFLPLYPFLQLRPRDADVTCPRSPLAAAEPYQ